jgi:hypothetical protein
MRAAIPLILVAFAIVGCSGSNLGPSTSGHTPAAQYGTVMESSGTLTSEGDHFLSFSDSPGGEQVTIPLTSFGVGVTVSGIDGGVTIINGITYTIRFNTDYVSLVSSAGSVEWRLSILKPTPISG